MSSFIYEAVDPKGQRVQGTEEARDESQLVQRLAARGLQPVSVRKERAFGLLLKASKRRLGHEEILYMTGELADLLDAGISLERALAILGEASESEFLRAVLQDIRRKIQSGQGLSEALSAYPESFSRLYVNMVKVGELGGVLPEVLRKLSEFQERSREIRSFILASSVYPCILAVVGVISVAVLVTFVVPKFGQIFEDLNQPMPLMTRVIVRSSTFLRDWGWVVGCVLVTLSLGGYRYVKTPRGRAWWDEKVLRLPAAGSMVRWVEIGRLARTLGTLIESGVPILKSISLSKEVVGNSVIRRAMDEVYLGVRQGKGMSKLMKDSHVFPPLVVHLVAIGEETGAMGPMLLKVADDLEEKVRAKTKLYLSLIEPVTIVVMGLLIGGIILSMLMAIFGINDVTF